MNKNTIITSSVICAGLFALYYFTMSKTAYAKQISKRTGIDFRKYLTFDKGYLKSRASAFKSGADSFVFSGKTFITETGRQKI